MKQGTMVEVSVEQTSVESVSTAAVQKIAKCSMISKLCQKKGSKGILNLSNDCRALRKPVVFSIKAVL